VDVEAATYWLGWVRSIQLIAVFLVAIGVVAEFGGEWISRPLEKTIDDARELELARLNNETARLRAKEQFVDDALLANAQAARDLAFAAEQNIVTSERIAFAQGLITSGQMSEAARSLSIIPKVSPFAGKQFDAVTASIGLGVFLRSLRAALTGAGWIEVDRGDIGERQREQSSVRGGPVLVTIQIDSTRDAQLLDAGETLASALNAEGIAATVNPKTETDISVNVIHILVGLKP
jgi:hypothetical protein